MVGGAAVQFLCMGEECPITARNNVYVLRMAADVAETAGASPFPEARCAPEPRRRPEIAQELSAFSSGNGSRGRQGKRLVLQRRI